MLVKRMAFALLGVGMLVGAGAARLRAESYGSAVLSLNPNVYYRLGEPAGAADGRLYAGGIAAVFCDPAASSP